MMHRAAFTIPLLTPALFLSGCSSYSASETVASAPEQPIQEREVSAGGQCNARGLQSWLQTTATQDLGAHLLKESGARSLQWIPPEARVTADLRYDRLRVSYDYEMTIKRIACE
jgi:hypothetical protein